MVEMKTATETAFDAHPAAFEALQYICELSPDTIAFAEQSFSACAEDGEPIGCACLETLNRVQKGEPVDDRHLLGLAFILHQMVCSCEEG